MKSLPIYLTESLHGMFEARGGDRTKETKMQELLTCVFFDAYFNMNKNFKTPEDIVEYYTQLQQSIIPQLCGGGIKMADFDDFMLSTKLAGRGKNKVETYSDKAKEWHASFLYQCESFDNWLDAHKSFPKKNLVFLHHDTSIGIRNGQITKNWTLDDRVEVGAQKAGYSNKDDYQKADIYALTQNVDMKPEDDIMQELAYWKQPIEGKAPISFVGISLKKISKPINHVHTYNMDSIAMTVDPESIKLHMPIFNGVQFSNFNAPVKTGGTSAAFRFTAELGGDSTTFNLDIRTSAAGAESRVFIGSSNPKNKKNAYDCFSVTASTQLTAKGADAQLGRAQDILQKWAKETGTEYSGSIKANKSAKEGVWGSSLTYKARVQEILRFSMANHIDCEGLGLNSSAASLIDWVADNADTIYDMFAEYTKAAGASSRGWNDVLTKYGQMLGIDINEQNYHEVLTNLFEAVKWKSATWSILNIIRVLFARAEKDNFGINTTLTQLAMFAKGISFDAEKIHLPYVMIG